jgi:short coiled-coil protein
MATESPSEILTVNEPATVTVDMPNSTSSASSSSSSVHEERRPRTPQDPLKRPTMTSRKSSGTIIVPREHPKVELGEGDEEFDEDDARAMSPRRSSQDVEKMSQEARAQLNEYASPSPRSTSMLTSTTRHAKVLQKSLLEIFNRIEAVKEEHDKLDNNNKFLQKYIGDLMSTSKITSTGASGRKK